MNTKDFQTMTVNISRKNPFPKNIWGIALDIGYSAVKGFSPNRVYSFPSYAKKMTGTFTGIGELDPKSLYYKDEKDQVWLVGSTAQKDLSTQDTNDSVLSLYGRNRYFSSMFLVLARTGLALGMIENEYGDPNGKELYIQTGLPPAFAKADAPLLRQVLGTTHVFEVKRGNNPWQKFSFTLLPERIKIMAQPMGSFLSAFLTGEGKYIPSASDYTGKKALILDGGFGTTDLYSLADGRVDGSESLSDLGMKEVFKRTSEKIFDAYHEEIPVPAFQQILDEGQVFAFDRVNRKGTYRPFIEFLEESNRQVCREVLTHIDNAYDLRSYGLLLVTGGTGAAWLSMIREAYSGLGTLKVVTGNQNDELSHTFSNVRGYYLFLLRSLS